MSVAFHSQAPTLPRIPAGSDPAGLPASMLVDLVWAADLGLLLLACVVAQAATSGRFWPSGEHAVACLTGSAVVLLRLAGSGSYRISALRSASVQLALIGPALLLGGGMVAACLLLLDRGGKLDAWLLGWTFGGAGLVLALRCVLAGLLRTRMLDELLARRIAVVGATAVAGAFIERMQARPSAPVNILGVFDDRGHPGLRVAGTLDDLLARSRRERIDDIVLALPLAETDRIRETLDRLDSAIADIVLAPDLFVLDFGAAGSEPVVTLRRKPLGEWQHLQKAVFDRLLASLFLLLLSPLLLAIALAIRLDSPGPVLFRQKRLGFNNHPFEVLKFRTMYHHCADLLADRQTSRGDPRVTPLGRRLRRHGLDELPQLLNVLRGDMSLVGPRPHALNTRADQQPLEAVVSRYALRHRVKPGITGWAQVNGHRGEIRTAEQIRKRVELDLHYVEHWSLALDCRILLLTLVREVISPHAF
ncbi:MAG: exopolysaccharide biosynthesis polyprenyl glycosylphosphotransferase [Acidisphaera sp.]|nr:exopolysaccharide biosynthesis polyprenyl glycosylphosphotransferase [Acidisphaera sp.]